MDKLEIELDEVREWYMMSLIRAHRHSCLDCSLCILPLPQRVGLCCIQFAFVAGMLEGVIHIVLRLLQGQRSESAITWYCSDLQERNIENERNRGHCSLVFFFFFESNCSLVRSETKVECVDISSFEAAHLSWLHTSLFSLFCIPEVHHPRSTPLYSERSTKRA